MHCKLSQAFLEDSYSATIPEQPDLGLHDSRWRVLEGTRQTLAERVVRPSKKSQTDGRRLSRGMGQMSDISTECLEFSFGQFRLIPERQLLVGGEKPVNLGARGLELLHALVEHSGEVISKDQTVRSSRRTR
jgi:DNA-binding response OmpR family regulator